MKNLQPEGLTLSRGGEREPSSRALLVRKEISSHFSEDILPLSERETIGYRLIDLSLSCMGGRFISCRQPAHDLVFICSGCGNVRIVPSSCNVRFCPRCNSRRFRLLQQKFGSGLNRMRAPTFLTLSCPSSSDLDRDALDYLTKSFSTLRRSKCFRRVRGGFYDYDVTFNASGLTWNLHIHAVIDAPFLNRLAIYDRWLKITADRGGKTRNVYLERAYYVDHGSGRKVRWHPSLNVSKKIRVLKACSNYLIKHATKAPAVPEASMLADFLFASYHKRLLQGFGNMFDLPPVEHRPMVCAECGGTSWAFEGYAVALAEFADRLLDRPLRHYRAFSWDAG
jgi:hypothetical protein